MVAIFIAFTFLSRIDISMGIGSCDFWRVKYDSLDFNQSLAMIPIWVLLLIGDSIGVSGEDFVIGENKFLRYGLVGAHAIGIWELSFFWIVIEDGVETSNLLVLSGEIELGDELSDWKSWSIIHFGGVLSGSYWTVVSESSGKGSLSVPGTNSDIFTRDNCLLRWTELGLSLDRSESEDMASSVYE